MKRLPSDLLLSNIQTITFDRGRILPNLSTDLGLGLSRFKMVDYSSTSAGATINVLADSYIHDLGSYYSGQLLLSAEVLVNGHTHSYSFGGTSFSSPTQGAVYETLRESTRANIAGTGGVDTININGGTPAILPVPINGGKGDDIINVSGGNAVLSGLTIVYGIDGGNDTVNGAGAVTQIYLGGNIRYTDVTRDIGIDDAEITIAGPRDFCGGARVRAHRPKFTRPKPQRSHHTDSSLNSFMRGSACPHDCGYGSA